MPYPLSLLQTARLYGILDLGYTARTEIVKMARALGEGGVDILQLRAKSYPAQEVESMAREVQPVLRDLGIPFVINDHIEVASAVGSDGAHIGQDDGPLAEARKKLGTGCWVGRSTHSPQQAAAAQAEGADYLGFGPLYATGTKPDYVPIGLADIRAVHESIKQPIFCIGGVNAARLDEVLAAGARRVVVVSAFLQAPDVRHAVASLKARLPDLPN